MGGLPDFQVFYRRGRLVSTHVAETGEIPEEMNLDQNHPNPFNDETRIRYRIAGGGGTREIPLRVFDVLGREVATLLAEPQAPGVHTTVWNAGALPSGVYVIRLDGSGRSVTRKAVLIR
jgi:hypothetical protein